jgi:hypothetical protein
MVVSKHSLARGVHTLAEFVSLTGKHELEQLGHRLRILLDLPLRIRVQDRKTGVDVPLIGVDAQRDVHLNVLDTTNVARAVPWELIVGEPSSAHTKEGGMGHSLCVGCDAIVLLGSEIDVLGLEAGHDILHESKVGI